MLPISFLFQPLFQDEPQRSGVHAITQARGGTDQITGVLLRLNPGKEFKRTLV